MECCLNTNPKMNTASGHSSHSQATRSFAYGVSVRTIPCTCLLALGNAHLTRYASARPQRLCITCLQPQFTQGTSRLIQTLRLPFSRTIGLNPITTNTSRYAVLKDQGLHQQLIGSGITKGTQHSLQSLKFCCGRAPCHPIKHHWLDYFVDIEQD